ncbi:hypothetical protein NQT66_13125 [Cellulophaga baltica]|uniref:hypothetical protein n=1 Tax=Cellulophaga baltica TaxID=76594 RepID=UPI0021489747|nr:hypothetical protein [Cellulophaga baltica]MCR1025758.1 hypothetical protein [Cellulophaga baltica]
MIRYHVRSKTGFNFNIKILSLAKEILDFDKNNISTKYVFTILLTDNLELDRIENRKYEILKTYNKDLKGLAELFSIIRDITSYFARHGVTNYMMQNGISTDIIRDSLGIKRLALPNRI